METSKKQISLFTEDKSTSSQADSLANHTQQQANDLEKKMTVISGQKCLEQLERLNHVGLWAKTFVALLIGMEDWYSKRCRLTWKMKGTKYNRLYFQLQASTLLTKETECGLLLKTPCAADSYSENLSKKEQKMGNSGTLAQEIATGFVQKRGLMLPTPSVSCVEGGQQADRVERNPSGGYVLRKKNNPNVTYGAKLSDAMIFEANQMGIDGKTFQLNPLFVEEMMGFPKNWTALPFLSGEKNQSKPTETQ